MLPGGRGYGLVLPRVVVAVMTTGVASTFALGGDRVVAVVMAVMAASGSRAATVAPAVVGVGVGCRRTVSGLFTEGGRSLLRRL